MKDDESTQSDIEGAGEHVHQQLGTVAAKLDSVPLDREVGEVSAVAAQPLVGVGHQAWLRRQNQARARQLGRCQLAGVDQAASHRDDVFDEIAGGPASDELSLVAGT